jgi:hypothetical protein
MVKTRGTTAPPPAPLPTTHDQDEVDYGDDALTDLSELERQLGMNDAGTSAELQVEATPEPQAPTNGPVPTAVPSTAAIPPPANGPTPAADGVTLPTTLISGLVNTMNALVTHLGAISGPHGTQAAAQTSPTQGSHQPLSTPPENPRVQSIRNRWPAVDPVHLQEILENRFRVENLLKLNASFVYTPDRRLENIHLGSFEIPTTARNVRIQEYQEINYLLKPLAVYADILHEFAPSEIRAPLSSAMLKYIHHLLDINERCTWHSVRLYHFSFHRKRVLMGVNDYTGWEDFNDRELAHLLHPRSFNQSLGGKRSPEDHLSGPPAKKIAGTAVSANSSARTAPGAITDACRRHNRGLCVAGTTCKYRHVCWTCADGTHIGAACPRSQQ